MLCNGDLVFDPEIIIRLKKMNGFSAIAIDDSYYSRPIDSPGVLIEHDKITDFEWSDIKGIGYSPESSIPASMAD